MLPYGLVQKRTEEKTTFGASEKLLDIMSIIKILQSPPQEQKEKTEYMYIFEYSKTYL